MLMNLRKCANHPLLIRDHYDLHKLETMARLLKTRDSGHKQAIESYIVEDLKIMSDFEINKIPTNEKSQYIFVVYFQDVLCCQHKNHQSVKTVNLYVDTIYWAKTKKVLEFV